MGSPNRERASWCFLARSRAEQGQRERRRGDTFDGRLVDALHEGDDGVLRAVECEAREVRLDISERRDPKYGMTSRPQLNVRRGVVRRGIEAFVRSPSSH